MFSFHKPKTYRSGNGCCICKAKSSSSRFTDSKRYEEDFSDCFKLSEKRTGEICNACVLLVKRWKKLPRGSERNWQHVVDARAGHGSKPMSRINKVKKPPVIPSAKRDKLSTGTNSKEFTGRDKKDTFYIPKLIRTTRDNREESPFGEFGDDGQCEYLSNESGSYDSSLAASPIPSPEETNTMDIVDDSTPLSKKNCSSAPYPTQENQTPITFVKHCRKERKKRNPKKSFSTKCSFLDLDFWKREKTCCGIIFKGPCGEVLLDRRFLNPCNCRTPPSTSPQSEIPSEGYFSDKESSTNNAISESTAILPPVSDSLSVPLPPSANVLPVPAIVTT